MIEIILKGKDLDITNIFPINQHRSITKSINFYIKYLVRLGSFLNSKKSSLKEVAISFKMESWLNPMMKSLRERKV